MDSPMKYRSASKSSLKDGQCVYLIRKIVLCCAGSGSRDRPVQSQKQNNKPAFEVNLVPRSPRALLSPA